MKYDTMSSGYDPVEQAALQNSFVNRVFGWMFAGLAVSGLVAWKFATDYVSLLQRYPNMILVLILLTLGLVMFLSLGINRMSAATATVCFVVYAALNGVMLSSVFLAYSLGSVAQAFCAAAVTFGVMGVYGYVTKKDLSGIGSICAMGLLGIIIASVINMFWYSNTADLVISALGVLIFVGLTAYDMQKIRHLAEAAGEGVLSEEIVKKYAVIGALTLYLDFINLFLYMLRFFGRRRD